MNAHQDLINLYSGRILALAASIPNTERLGDPDGSAKKRSPLCGSTVTVDIKQQNGVVTAFGQDVKACALGQSAASVIGANVVGCTIGDICKLRDELRAMLRSGGPVPSAPFSELEVLLPAAEFRNRHASILLCAEATAEALEMATNSHCA